MISPYPWLSTLANRFGESVAGARLGHALLLTGPAGVGKRELAHNMVSSLLCQRCASASSPTTPCGECPACVQCRECSHPDLHVVDQDEKAAVISVSAVRDLCAKLQLTSQMAGYRVGLFPDVDRCNEAASNSLLKTLEEPPDGVFMLLLSARPGRLPATIRSRCQIWRCPLPPACEAEAWLREHGVADPVTALRHAGGAPLIALDENVGELNSVLRSTLAEVLSRRTSVVQGAKALEKFGSDAVLAACVNAIDDLFIGQADALSSGLQLACFGVDRSARQLFAWRDVAAREFARNRTGLNELATLERVLAASCGDVPAAISA